MEAQDVLARQEVFHKFLPFRESLTLELYHAAASTLVWVGRVPLLFQRDIKLSELEAFRSFRLALFKSRRDMVMLGLLRKIKMGTTPPLLQVFFPKLSRIELQMRQRLRDRRAFHTRHFSTTASVSSSNVL